jgi:hypothetical protein
VARFTVFDRERISPGHIELRLAALRESWNLSTDRQFMPDSDWLNNLTSYINGLIDLRANHVRLWLDSNMKRFQTSHGTVEDLRRQFETMVVEMRANVQFCGADCSSCHLLCVRVRRHEGEHSCQTTHECVHVCRFCKHDEPKPCGTPYVLISVAMTVS